MEKQEKVINDTPHMVTIDCRKRIMLTGIKEVVSSLDKAVVCKITGKILEIDGADLRVSKLSLEEGLLIIDGEINGLKYRDETATKSFFKRLFK